MLVEKLFWDFLAVFFGYFVVQIEAQKFIKSYISFTLSVKHPDHLILLEFIFVLIPQELS